MAPIGYNNYPEQGHMCDEHDDFCLRCGTRRLWEGPCIPLPNVSNDIGIGVFIVEKKFNINWNNVAYDLFQLNPLYGEIMTELGKSLNREQQREAQIRQLQIDLHNARKEKDEHAKS